MKNKYKTKDGLGDVYQKIANGECVCYFTTADCPVHRTITTSIYSTSTSTAAGTNTRRFGGNMVVVRFN